MKKSVTVDDLPFLVADMLGGQRYKTFRVLNCVVTTTMRMKPCANIQVEYNGKIYEDTAQGSGGYDAFMNALHKLAPKMGLTIPKLTDFEISIPPADVPMLWSRPLSNGTTARRRMPFHRIRLRRR